MYICIPVHMCMNRITSHSRVHTLTFSQRAFSWLHSIEFLRSFLQGALSVCSDIITKLYRCILTSASSLPLWLLLVKKCVPWTELSALFPIPVQLYFRNSKQLVLSRGCSLIFPCSTWKQSFQTNMEAHSIPNLKLQCFKLFIYWIRECHDTFITSDSRNGVLEA